MAEYMGLRGGYVRVLPGRSVVVRDVLETEPITVFLHPPFSQLSRNGQRLGTRTSVTFE